MIRSSEDRNGPAVISVRSAYLVPKDRRRERYFDSSRRNILNPAGDSWRRRSNRKGICSRWEIWDCYDFCRIHHRGHVVDQFYGLERPGALLPNGRTALIGFRISVPKAPVIDRLGGRFRICRPSCPKHLRKRTLEYCCR